MDEMKKYRCKDGDVTQEMPGTCPTHNTPLEEVCDCGSDKMASECCKMPAVPAVPETPAEPPAETTPVPEAFPPAVPQETPVEPTTEPEQGEQPPAMP